MDILSITIFILFQLFLLKSLTPPKKHQIKMVLLLFLYSRITSVSETK